MLLTCLLDLHIVYMILTLTLDLHIVCMLLTLTGTNTGVYNEDTKIWQLSDKIMQVVDGIC